MRGDGGPYARVVYRRLAERPRVRLERLTRAASGPQHEIAHRAMHQSSHCQNRGTGMRIVVSRSEFELNREGVRDLDLTRLRVTLGIPLQICLRVESEVGGCLDTLSPGMRAIKVK